VTEALLGEHVLDTWIGPIDVVPAPELRWFARLRGKAPRPSAEPVESSTGGVIDFGRSRRHRYGSSVCTTGRRG